MNTRQPPTARDFMTTHVQTVPAELPLAEVVAFLLKHNVSTAPVVEPLPSGDRRLLGFLSERDCLEHLSNEIFYGNPVQPQTAATMMQRHPVCVAPETDVFTLASILVSHGFRHLPVVSGEAFLGIVSRRDILAALDKFSRERQTLADEQREAADLDRITNYRLVAQRIS